MRDPTDKEQKIIEKALIDSGKPVEVPIDPHMHLRSFTIFQTSEGWFWNWPHLKRAVGPLPTLPSAIADLQSVMGIEVMRHDPKTGPCPTCGFQIKQMGRAKPMVIEED